MELTAGDLMNEVNVLTAERDALRAENERLRAEVKELNEGIRYWMDEVEKLSAAHA